MLKLNFILFFIGCFVAVESAYSQKINTVDFYAAFASDDTAKINKQLKFFERSNSIISQAYKGALLMKKSSTLKSPKSKLNMFKDGKNLLEQAIQSQNENAEFRFLRLVIQENCPAILKYNSNIQADADSVKKFYKNFSSELKHAAVDYAKVSKILKVDDLTD